MYDRVSKGYNYLEAVLLETLRLYPPVPFLYRCCVKDTKLPGDEGHIVRQGEGVIVHTYGYSRNTKGKFCEILISIPRL